MPGADWYIFAGNREQGPFTAEQIRDFVNRGKLKPDMGLKKEGMQEFVPASSVKGLFDSAAPPATQAIRSAAQQARPQPAAPPAQPPMVAEPEYLDDDQGYEEEEAYPEAEEVYDEEAYEAEPEPEPEPAPRRGRRGAGGRSRRTRGGGDDDEAGAASGSRRGRGAGGRSRRGRGGDDGAGASRRGRGGGRSRGGGGGEPKGGGMGIASFICGLLALLLCWLPIINAISVLLGLVAIILGIIGFKRALKGLAITGFITGLIGFGWSVYVWVVILLFAGAMAQAGQEAWIDMEADMNNGTVEWTTDDGSSGSVTLPEDETPASDDLPPLE